MLLYQTGEEEKAARLWPKWKQGGRQIPNLRGGATSHWQVVALQSLSQMLLFPMSPLSVTQARSE